MRSILYLVGEYPSLTETFIQNEIDFVKSQGLDVHVCSLNRVGVDFRSVMRVLADKRVRRLLGTFRGDEHAPRLRKILGALARAGELARHTDAAHIHAHFLGTPALTAFFLSRLTGATFSVTAHARDIYTERTPAGLLQSARYRFSCTESNCRHLAEKYGLPFELVRHGVDLGRIGGSVARNGTGPCRILSVGRLVPKKGFRHLIDACALLRAEGFSFTCRIVGDGPLRGELEEQITNAGLGEFVELVGSLPHCRVLEAYRRADVFVAASVVADDGDRDGVPNCILEAMGSCVPVVATDAGSILEAVEDGVTGLVVSQGRPEEIAGRCLELWREPERARQLTRDALSLLESRFDAGYWNHKLLNALCETVG